MPTPKEAPVLQLLKSSLDGRWPERDRKSDGWIGDTAHQGQKSDHNPDSKSGVVRARDIDKDGIHVPTVLGALMIHPSTSYVIHDERIYRRSDSFQPRKYEGSNPHHSHIHESIMSSPNSENSKTDFSLIKWGSHTWTPTLILEHRGWDVRELQAVLNGYGFNLKVDGHFGSLTDSAVRQFQRAFGLEVDGIVGPLTRGKLTP